MVHGHRLGQPHDRGLGRAVGGAEGVDSATMFGDFFFVEALCRVALPGRLRPELPVGM